LWDGSDGSALGQLLFAQKQPSTAKLKQMLTAACGSELLSEGYVPDVDLACARIAKAQLGAEVVRENLPDEIYPADAVF
jgi:hypothetical protein